MDHEIAGKVRVSADELESGLSRWAQRSAASRGRERPEEPCGLRTPYARDRGRIVHCKAFRRLEHKTQVFIAPEGDHYRTRLTHTLEVSGIARSVARALRLNEDLTEAVALGHDLGHTPFGHAGEKVMRDILKELGAGEFAHNEQSVRVVEVVENDGQGLNLTWEVRDGIRHHTGAVLPATLEAQIVRFADRIAYINHDIDDALRAGLLALADLPHAPMRLLGRTGSDRIDTLVHDLVDTSYETGTITQSPAVAKAMLDLRAFMFRAVYPQSLERAGEQRVRHVITNLMRYFLEHPEEMRDESPMARADHRQLTLEGVAAPAVAGAPARSGRRRRRRRARGRSPGPHPGGHRLHLRYDRPVCPQPLPRPVRAPLLGGAMIKDSCVQAVLEAADIVDVISGYTSLRKRGITYSGLCPFHQEKTPSFSVNAEKGLYYCFGCGEGGDVRPLLGADGEPVVHRGHRAAGRAVRHHRGIRGCRRPRHREAGPRSAPPAVAREGRDVLSALTSGNHDRPTPRASISRSVAWAGRSAGRSGWACRRMSGGDCTAGRPKRGSPIARLEEAGLLVRQTGKTYDRFRGRLMFPLVDHRGRVVGFGGRTLKDENPKYLNSPEGPLYQKGRLLYGLYQARRAIAEADEVMVVEGYTDVLGLAQAGAQNVVASMGTSLTDGQINLMTRFTNNVTFMFDADRAGTEAMLRSGELARGHSLRPRVALLPAGEDPADIAVQGGREEVSRVLAGKMSLLGFELRQSLERSDTATADGRVRAFEEVRRIMDRAGSLKEREEEICLSSPTGCRLSPDSVAMLLAAPSGAQGQASRDPGGTRRDRHDPTPSCQEAVLEREFLVAAACHPERAAGTPRGAHSRPFRRSQ